MKKIRLLCLFILLVGAKAVFSQALNLVGENYLILNGERFKNQKIPLTKAAGSWFASPNDSHGTVTLYGNFEGRQLQLDLEWDGKSEQHTITDEIRHDGKRTGEFLISMKDKAVYGDGLNASPVDNDEIQIRIIKADDLSVSGELSGIITQSNKKVKVGGVFNLKRSAGEKKLASSSYKDCDNVVHDKLIGAQDRSPSECEAKFDLDVRTAIHDALLPLIEKFQNDGWEINQQTNLEPLLGVARGSENDIFSTSYDLLLRVGRTSAIYTDYQKRFNDLSEKLKDASRESRDQFMKFGREMNGALNSNIYFMVNNHSAGFGNFKGGSKVTKLSSNIYIIQSPYVQSSTGGDENEAIDATLVLIGKWKQPVIEKNDDGSENVRVNPVLDSSASHLQVQNIVIRIECNPSVAKAIIDTMNLKNLQDLIK